MHCKSYICLKLFRASLHQREDKPCSPRMPRPVLALSSSALSTYWLPFSFLGLAIFAYWEPSFVVSPLTRKIFNSPSARLHATLRSLLEYQLLFLTPPTVVLPHLQGRGAKGPSNCLTPWMTLNSVHAPCCLLLAVPLWHAWGLRGTAAGKRSPFNPDSRDQVRTIPDVTQSNRRESVGRDRKKEREREWVLSVYWGAKRSFQKVPTSVLLWTFD